MNSSVDVDSGSGRIAIADRLMQPQKPAANPARDKARPASTPAADAAARCSPDPCQHTDRYRLVTPFSLRL
ncbi:MAG: hypothetical protein ABL997_21080 [Planctomycetota bacterium]